MHSMYIDQNGGCSKPPKFVLKLFAAFINVDVDVDVDIDIDVDVDVDVGVDVDVDVDVVDWIVKEDVDERNIDENSNEVTLCCCS